MNRTKQVGVVVTCYLGGTKSDRFTGYPDDGVLGMWRYNSFSGPSHWMVTSMLGLLYTYRKAMQYL
jgi:hypothetical protein